MLSRFRILIGIIALFVAIGCNHRAAEEDHIFDIVSYSPHNASGFVIESDREHNILIRVTRPWQGKAPTEQRLAIFQSEEEASHYRGQHIVGHAKRIVCMSSSYIAMLDAIDRADAVVGVSGKQYIFNSTIGTNPNIKDIGYDSNIDYEALLALRPDIVLMYGITSEDSIVTAKLRELKIPYLYLGDYTEQSPLGKAEWVVVIGEIVGCRDYAEQIFNDIVERYNAIKSSIATTDRPKVMFNLPYQDVWYMPSDDSYIVRLVEDAGGEYIYKGLNPSGGSRGISLEEALILVNRADIWLNPSQVLTLDELRAVAPHFASSKVVRSGKVYNNNRIRTQYGGSDFWESAIVRPDVVLRDLAAILGDNDTDLYYHHKLK